MDSKAAGNMGAELRQEVRPAFTDSRVTDGGQVKQHNGWALENSVLCQVLGFGVGNN